MIENAPAHEQIITLRSVYKFPRIKLYPTKDKNTGRFLGGVKAVDSNGDPIVKPHEVGQYFAKETDSVELKEGWNIIHAGVGTVFTWLTCSSPVCESIRKVTIVSLSWFATSKKAPEGSIVKYRGQTPRHGS